MATTTAKTAATLKRIDISPKDSIRHQMRMVRRKQAPAWVEKTSRQVLENLLAHPEWKKARTVGLYLSTPTEVQTGALLTAAWAAGKTVCVPAIKRAYDRYEMSRFEKGDATRTGSFNLQEPAAPKWVSITDLDLVIVPCVGFDRFGRRVGHGGGHYDKLLANHPGTKICIAFGNQKLTAVPVEPHDVLMDFVITEAEVLDTRA